MRITPDSRLTDKPILSTLLILSGPIIAGEIMQLMYNLADTFWVGRLGPEYLAAMSISFPVIFVVFSIAGGFSIAGMTLVSQYTGAGQAEQANLAAGQILVFACGLSVLFSGLGLIYGRGLLQLMGAEPEVLPLAWDYFRIMTYGIPLIFVYFIFSSVLQGIGDTVTPMKLKAGAVTANMVLDPLLILGLGFFPALDIRGAAIATVFTRFGAAAVGIYWLSTGTKGIHIRMEHLWPDRMMIGKIVRIGTPAAVGISGLSIAVTIMTSIVATFGTLTLAAWGVAKRITSIFFQPAMGVSRAVGVMVGQHLGADQPGEAGKTAWTGAGVIFGAMLCFAVLLVVAAPYLVGVFTGEAEVIFIGTEYLKIAGFAYAFLGLQQALSGALRGAGKTVQQMGFQLFTLWILQIPLSYYLAHIANWDRLGVWWGIFFAKLLGSAVLVIWFMRGTWKSRVIEEPATQPGPGRA